MRRLFRRNHPHGPGAALAAVAALKDVVQSVLTGSSRPNATLKLRAFGLDQYLDLAIGGFAGSEAYPMGALLRATRLRAEENRRAGLRNHWPVDSSRLCGVCGCRRVLFPSEAHEYEFCRGIRGCVGFCDGARGAIHCRTHCDLEWSKSHRSL